MSGKKIDLGQTVGQALTGAALVAVPVFAGQALSGAAQLASPRLAKFAAGDGGQALVDIVFGGLPVAIVQTVIAGLVAGKGTAVKVGAVSGVGAITCGTAPWLDKKARDLVTKYASKATTQEAAATNVKSIDAARSKRALPGGEQDRADYVASREGAGRGGVR